MSDAYFLYSVVETTCHVLALTSTDFTDSFFIDELTTVMWLSKPS